jgi:hypothetical protein
MSWCVEKSRPFDPLPSRTSGQGVDAVPKPLLEGTDEDDGKPYTVPGDPVPKVPCPKCKKSLPAGVIVCAHCGFNQETGETFERFYEKIDKEWEPGLRFPARFSIFLAAGGIALATTLIVGLADGEWIALLLSFLGGLALLAYVLGTYPRINLVRNVKGRVRLTRTWRIGFYPLAPVKIRWRQYDGVSVGQAPDADFWDWSIVLVLAPWGLIPAVLWWLYVIHPGQFDAALCQGHGFPVLLLYRGPNAALAQEIAGTVLDVTGLPKYTDGGRG